MLKSELVKLLDEEYNFNNQEDWDNCGPNPVHYTDEEISKIFISLDMDINTLQKAINNGCNVIISHHPILLDSENEEVEKINKTNELINNLLLKHNILNICLHTCYDNTYYGTSYQIYKELKNILNFEDFTYLNEEKYLLYTTLKVKMTIKELIAKIKSASPSTILNLRTLNIYKNTNIKRICIGAGSCCSMLDKVIDNADCFLTGDVKWHNYLDGLNNDLAIIDISHTAERVFIKGIYNLLKEKNHNLEIVLDYDLIAIEDF